MGLLLSPVGSFILASPYAYDASSYGPPSHKIHPVPSKPVLSVTLCRFKVKKLASLSCKMYYITLYSSFKSFEQSQQVINCKLVGCRIKICQTLAILQLSTLSPDHLFVRQSLAVFRLAGPLCFDNCLIKCWGHPFADPHVLISVAPPCGRESQLVIVSYVNHFLFCLLCITS